MTAAILDVRPTVKPGVELYAGGRRATLNTPPAIHRSAQRRILLCRWRPDLEGRLVCVWKCTLVSPGLIHKMRRPGAEALAIRFL